MKRLNDLTAIAVMLFFVFIFAGCGTSRYGTSGMQTSYENPQWAPPYYDGARYYYLPDIESYYDIYTREFIYLNHAQWIYSPYIPSIYSDFNLNNSFIVVVNSNIYQPWMHHQYYISHFPRYYYRDYYDHSNIPYVRGYNENIRGAIYWTETERDKARSWDDENLRNNRQFRYSREDRRQQNIMNQGGTGNNPVYQRSQTENSTTQPAGNDNTAPRQPGTTTGTRRPHNTNYYGKPIGQPVQVDRQMRIQNVTVPSDRNSNNPGTPRSNSENNNDPTRPGRR